VTEFRFRLIDTAGGEIGIVALDTPAVNEDDTVPLPDGSAATVLEVYDDDDGREGGVLATIVVDSDS
jgi:hypothetical protein